MYLGHGQGIICTSSEKTSVLRSLVLKMKKNDLLSAAPGEVPYGSLQFFALCGFGGILSCGSTHTAIVPLDLVKCRIQVTSESDT